MLIRFIGPLLLISILYYTVEVRSVLATLRNVDLKYFLLSFIGVPIAAVLRGVRWRMLLKEFSINMSLAKCMGVTLIAMIVGCIFPLVGNLVKLYFFKNKTVKLAGPLITIVLEKSLDFLVPCSFFLSFLGVRIIKGDDAYGLLDLCLLIAGGTFCLGVFKAVINFPPLFNLISRNVESRFGGYLYHFRQAHSCINWKIFAISIVDFLLANCLQTYFLALAIRACLGFVETIFISTVKQISMLIPVSYFGVGVREAGFIGAFTQLNYGPDTAVSLGAMVLCFQLVLALLGAIIYVVYPMQKETQE